MALTLLILVALLSFANGANDNGKGVATLVGFGAARPFTALLYATASTMLGGVASWMITSQLLKGFSGSWLFSQGIVLDRQFYIAVLIGACGWVLVASRTGMPVSTTHAIIGATCGAGLIGFGNAPFQWMMLGRMFLLPLGLSPVLSLATVYLLGWPISRLATRFAGRCVCVVEETVPQAAMALSSAGSVESAARGETQLALLAGTNAQCADSRTVALASGSAAGTALHWLSCGLISLSHGWNDTPKIVALSLLALVGVRHGAAVGFVIVILAMGAGGLIMGRKVLYTLSRKLTPLPLAESLTASMVTAFLVAAASWNAWPVSTTHVATGSIIGAGLKNDPSAIKWGKVGEIVLSWVITLPVAAVIAGIAKLLLRP